MRLLITLLLLLCCSCAPLMDELSRDSRDAPWDPDYSQGESLLDQIPNWDNEATKRCCGHTYPDCKPGQSPRC